LRGCINAHGLAEFYSVLTRAPFAPRIHPAEAGRFLDDNILPFFELVALSVDDYKAVLHSCSIAGLVGGVVFDALHLHSARKAGCDRVYTFNVKDFRSLAKGDLVGKIAAP
jgi:predicted nucleic acid-binding protein